MHQPGSPAPHSPQGSANERFIGLVRELCRVVGLPTAEPVLATGSLQVEGFDVRLENFPEDPGAIYTNFHFGTVTAGRTLTVFRLMLEANLLIYAQRQAQLGLDADTGGIVLIVRLPVTADVNGELLADTLAHYAEHGRYWRRNIIESTDEMFEGIANGTFLWLRA
jgi:hypothetical protein